MLDGAARIDDLVAAAVADGQPALAITDHGNMYGVLDFYRGVPRAGHHADHRHSRRTWRRNSRYERPVRRGRDRRHRRRRRTGREALLPPDRCSPRRTPATATCMKLSSRRLPRGLLLQAPGRLGAARAPPRGADRDDRLPRRASSLQALLAGDDRRGPRARRPAAGHLRSRQPLRRAPGPRDRRPAPHQPDARRDRPGDRRPAPRDERRPLLPARATPWPTTRCCACRPARRSTTRTASSSKATSTT